MIRVNGGKVELGHFPDGTLLMHENSNIGDIVYIEWYYDNDAELTALIFLAKHFREHGISEIHLYMPYIPNARQDRVKSSEDVFTLKYFADVINWLNFTSVTVLDPHSTVSEALINRINIESPQKYVMEAMRNIGNYMIMFYPDEGASKRYSGMFDIPYAFGIKKRDWKTGKILGLDVAGATEDISGNSIFIVDDICSKGGTFYYAAKKLKELGAKDIYLYISHCENSILEGELINSGLIKKIYTTDSIFTSTHPLIEVIECRKPWGRTISNYGRKYPYEKLEKP